MEAEYLEYITPDGEVFKFDTKYRWLMSEEEGTGLPDITYITQRGPNQHGVTVVDYRLEPRIVQLVVREEVCNRFDYWAARMELLSTLNPERRISPSPFTGILRKYFPNGNRLELDVVIQAGPQFATRSGRWDEWAYQETLRFVAHDPIYRDPDLVCRNWTVSDYDELKFPITFPIMFGTDLLEDTLTLNYLGNFPSFPTIVIVGPLDGALITNLTTNEKINIQHTISVGETVTVYLQYGNKRVVSSLVGDITGTVESYNDLVKFHIAPHPKATNGINLVKIQGMNADIGVTIAQISYYNRYIGY